MLGARSTPRLRDTINVRDDRPPSKQVARRAQSNSAVASAACLEGGAGVRYPIYTDVVDADLSKYFDSIPHGDLLKSVARRIVDRHVLRLIKLWLKAPIEEKD